MSSTNMSSTNIELQKEIEIINKLQKEYENSSYKNLCIECGTDLGYMNPRQLCGKTFCYEKILNKKNIKWII